MSVKVMGQVWDTTMPRDLKFILLAYADHADHDGGSVFPAVSTIMKKTGYSERSVQRITTKLVEAGYLLEDGQGPHGTNRWRVNTKILGGAKMTRVQEPTRKKKGIVPQGGAKKSAQIAPDPSLTRPDESQKIKPSRGSATADSPKPKTASQLMFETVAQVCGYYLPKLTKKERGMLNQAEKQLRQAGYTPEFIQRDFMDWFRREDWRGQKGQRPTISILLSEVSKAAAVEMRQDDRSRFEEVPSWAK